MFIVPRHPTATPILLLPTLPPPEETTPTATALIPGSETATSVVLESTATLTPQPTDTLQPTATPVSMLVMEIVSPGAQQITTPRPGACQPPPKNWIVYTVQRNDTLYSLGQHTSMDWRQIQTANCLPGTTIFAGRHLYLPYLPFTPSPLPAGIDPIEAPGAVGPGGDFTVCGTPYSGPPGTIFRIEAGGFEPDESVTIRIIDSLDATVFEKTSNVNNLGLLVEDYASPPNAPTGIYFVDMLGMRTYTECIFEITDPP